MTATQNRTPIRHETHVDEFAVLDAAFRSGDRERLRLAVAHADSTEVQQALSLSARAELADLIGEAHKHLSLNGRA